MTMPDTPAASLRLRVDTDALAANWRYLDSQSGAAATGAAVKANAYGVGVNRAVPALLAAGARHFFLAHWSEVPAILPYVESSMVSVLHGVRNAEEAAFAKETGVLPVINSVRQAALWAGSGGGPCHLMIDTGINRLGVRPGDLSDPAISALDVSIAMSHLASADEDSAQNAKQLAAFQSAAAHVEARHLSLANSAGIMLGSNYHFDLTRPGIALYGGTAHPAMAGKIAQVAYPEAAVIQIRELSPGDSVGYNALWTADKPYRAATVSIGYADGFLRMMGPGGALHHRGAQLPVLGKVSMDMIVVDVSGVEVKEGDFLSVPLDLPAVSARSGLSQYELLTVLGHRFDRS
ncbi:alanine racemase [Aurantiacibacter sp. D1-12]|uniref:alanine racemase n=1 Tax=Aurantiacibacter sp. D1-12 TaxID=2993658 RepID=UPI00237CA74C|nr:alanine racemase [Aurantiacibacter sp. D1-12]MDE1466733.1 alanine racemase [Aurantiacibacter sp. D1-12]